MGIDRGEIVTRAADEEWGPEVGGEIGGGGASAGEVQPVGVHQGGEIGAARDAEEGAVIAGEGPERAEGLEALAVGEVAAIDDEGAGADGLEDPREGREARRHLLICDEDEGPQEISPSIGLEAVA